MLGLPNLDLCERRAGYTLARTGDCMYDGMDESSGSSLMLDDAAAQNGKSAGEFVCKTWIGEAVWNAEE